MAGVESKINTTQVKKDNPGFFKKLYAGQIGATAAGVATSAATIPLSLVLMKQMCKLNHSLTKDEVNILNKAGEEVLKNSGLEQKGVKIFRRFSPSMKEALSKWDGCINTIPRKNKFLKKIRIILKELNPVRMSGRGKNAFFNTQNNEILAVDKMALSQFHEIGHAMNKFGKGGNFLQNIRQDLISQKQMAKAFGQAIKIPLVGKIAAGIAATIALVGIFKNKKAEGEKPKGFFDKTTTFIKNNVGKLTFLTMLPMVLEEGLASFKGEKAVKGLINKDLFKKVKLTNRLGLATYAIAAAATGIGAYMASKIRDKIAQPNLNKNM